MTHQDQILTAIRTLKSKSQKLATKRKDLLDRIKADHPHLCPECSGQGGEIEYDWGSFTEPPAHDFDPCQACLGEGKHPLDLNRSMTEEEVERFIDEAVDTVKYPHPLHAEINALMDADMMLGELHADLAIELDELNRSR